MSKVDEVKKILYAVRSRDCSVSRGAFTICQLFEPDKSLLLTPAEIKEIAKQTISDPVTDWEPEYIRAICEKQVTKCQHLRSTPPDESNNNTLDKIALNVQNTNIALSSTPDQNRLLSDEEMRNAVHIVFESNLYAIPKDYVEVGAKAQLAKDEARHEADKVKVREQTLKEVGEWLKERLPAGSEMGERHHTLIYREEIKELEQGRMP
jgi:hypothetical protein